MTYMLHVAPTLAPHVTAAAAAALAALTART